jgi:predicted dienelactone hydrolase
MSASAAGSMSTPPVAERKGCGETKLLEVPADPGATGPWPVGVKTAKIQTSGGEETVEIWYPAQLGSEAGKTKATYDLSSWLPPSDRTKIPASDNEPQPCNCYRDLPIDTAHGPYPPVIFVHGLASFRTGSLTTMTQWASRGFIVLAADHLGNYLLDFTASLCGGGGSGALGDMNGDVDAELAAINAKSGDFAFLGTSVDTSRVGIGGHSMGAMTVSAASTKPNVQVVILMAELGGSPVPASSSLKQVLVVGGMIDTVTQWSADLSAYQGSPMPKRLVGITGGDHLDVTDICSQTNAKGETSIDVGTRNGVCALGIVNGLAHCGSMQDPKQGPGIVNYVSTAVLEEVLQCADRKTALEDAAVKAKFSALGHYEHAP